MADRTHIQWTDATWNPVTGCTKVSEGCDHCYIERTPPFRINNRGFACPRCGGTGRVEDADGNHLAAQCVRCGGTGKAGVGDSTGVRLHHERLEQPLRWRKPRRVFVNSLSDLFHETVTDEYIAHVFAVMANAPRHTFQVLTKRPGRMRSLLRSRDFRIATRDVEGLEHSAAWPLPNVWLGTSVENQKWADIRIPQLLDTPAAIRFLSCEPLLGPVDLTPCNCLTSGRTFGCARHNPGSLTDVQINARDLHYPAIDWVIVGGESGPNARPMHPDWARTLRDQCVAAGVPYFFKQWGEWAPDGFAKGWLEDRRRYIGDAVTICGSDGFRQVMRRTGKKAAGRELDYRTWDEYPGGEQ